MSSIQKLQCANLLKRLAWLLLAVSFGMGPLLYLAGIGLGGLIHHPDWLLLAVPSGRRARLLAVSLAYSGGVALACMIVGVLAALWLMRRNTKHGSWLRGIFLIFLPLPPYIHALVWMAALQGVNTLLAALGLPFLRLHGWAAAVWIQSMSLLPLALGLALVAFQSLDPSSLEAGQVLAPGLRLLVKIILPLSAPILAAGAAFLFLLTMVDHSVPGLFGLNTYALDVYAEFSATNDPARVFWLAVPGLLLSFLVLWGAQGGIRRVTQPAAWSPRPVLQLALPAWFQTLERLAIAVVTLQVLVPLVALLLASGSPARWMQSVWVARSDIQTTFGLSLAAAIACLGLGYGLASGLPGRGEIASQWWLISLPLAIPAPLVGVALIACFNRPAWGAVYGSGLMPVAAAVARFLPFATILLAAQRRRMDPLVVDAARMVCGSTLRRTLKIRLPLLAPGLLAAAVLVFSLTMSELGATLLVIPAGWSTLTLRIYNYLHYGASAEVAGLCLALSGMLVLAWGLVIWMLSFWKHYQEVAS